MGARRSDRWLASALVLIVLLLAASAVATLMKGRLHYSNYWGGSVFAPFALVVAGLIIAVGVVIFLRKNEPKRKLSGKAARRARQAEKTKFPIDEYRKW